jgi:ABC-type transport system substrate-binding protein
MGRWAPVDRLRLFCITRSEEGSAMQRRTLVTGATAFAGLAALPWRLAWASDKGANGTLKYGGTLRVAFASDIHSGRFTMNRQTPPGYETFWVSNNTHNALVTLGPDYDIVPDLAQSWEILDKGKAYVFHLHENVMFHDGTPCDAAAVKWNFDDLLGREKTSWVYSYFTQVESTEAVDPHTFRVIMKEPAALLPVLAGYFHGIPIGSPTAVKKWGDDWNRHPVGTGAFTYDLADYKPDELVVLKKNPNYFNLNEMYPYDPDKARALLQEAGHDASNPVEFDLILNNNAPFFADAATLLKSQMEKIGVKMNLIMMDKPAWLDRFVNKSDFQMAMEDFGALVDINQRSLGFFREARANYGGINSPELEDLILQWRRDADPAKRRDIAHAMQRLLAKDMLWCNITGSPYFQAYRDYVKGYHFMNQLYVYWETTWLDHA